MKILLNLLEAALRVASRVLLKLREKQVKRLEMDSQPRLTNRAVVITTHSRRFFSGALPLIQSLRTAGSLNGIPIYVVINADTFGPFSQELRSDFLAACTQVKGVFPVCLGEPAGMSELWNTGLKAAGAEVTVVLSDDLAVLPGALDGLFVDLFNATETDGLVVLNHSWGHFAISRFAIEAVGWFDQRLLGFGEEDGDYAQRYLKHFGRPPKSLVSPGLYNISSETGFEEITKGTGKYSLFNRTFFRLKYGMTGESGFTDDLTLNESVGEAHRDPNWDFKQSNAHLLDEKDEEVIRTHLESYFSQAGKAEL